MILEQLLNEEKNKKYPHIKPWQFKTKEEIEKWAKDNNLTFIQVDNNLEIHYLHKIKEDEESVFFPNQTKPYKLPVNIALAESFFVSNVSTMYGFPRLITGGQCEIAEGYLKNLEYCPGMIQNGFFNSDELLINNKIPLESLEGLSPNITRVVIKAPVIKSLEGLHSDIETLKISGYQNIKDIYNLCPNLKKLVIIYNKQLAFSGLTSIFKFKNLDNFYITEQVGNKQTDESFLASQIINKHLEGKSGALACQDELLENGLKRFAR